MKLYRICYKRRQYSHAPCGPESYFYTAVKSGDIEKVTVMFLNCKIVKSINKNSKKYELES